jgi:hypothetical protein
MNGGRSWKWGIGSVITACLLLWVATGPALAAPVGTLQLGGLLGGDFASQLEGLVSTLDQFAQLLDLLVTLLQNGLGGL